MTNPEPAPGPLLDGLITLSATATAVHPEGADLPELPTVNENED